MGGTKWRGGQKWRTATPEQKRKINHFWRTRMKKRIICIFLVIVMSLTLLPMASLATSELSDDASVVFDGDFNFSSATVNGLNVGGANRLTLTLNSSAAVEGAQIRVLAVRYIPPYNSTDMPNATGIPGGITLMTNEIGHYFDHYQAIPLLATDVTVNLPQGESVHTVRLSQILYMTLATQIEVVLPQGSQATVGLVGAPVASLDVPGIDWGLLHTLTPTGPGTMNNLTQVVPDSIRTAADDPLFSLAEQYSEFFQIGNVNSQIVPGSAWARQHFNTVTAENHHKPSFLQNAAGAWTLNNATSNALVNYAIANDVDVVGHVLIWHGQSQNLHHPGPASTREQAMVTMENYIRTVLQHFDQHVFPPESARAGQRIFSAWDVINEAFINEIPYVSEEDANTPGTWKRFLRKSTQTVRGWENAPGSGNPGHVGGAAMANRFHWYDAFANGADLEAGESGADFVYYSFVFARRYSDTVLVYNDFNIYEEGKALMVAQMVSEINARYAYEQPNYEFFGGPDPRQLIEVVGMQGHWYLQDTPARDPQRGVQRALEILREIDVRVHISELDLFVHFPYGAQGGGHFGAPQLRHWQPSWLDNTQGDTTYWRTRFGLPIDEPPPANFGRYIEAIQAQKFAEIFMVLKENADIVDRVTFWGLRDNNSWRAALAPLLWYADVAGQPNPKMAYYAVAFPAQFLGYDPVTPPTQSVNLVRITPASTDSLQAGYDRSFVAGVFGNGSPAQSVKWTVEGGVSGTSISEDGVLTVAPFETAQRLRIRATSTVDPSVYGIAVMDVEIDSSLELADTFDGTNPRNLNALLEQGYDVILQTPNNLGIFAQHSPLVVPEGTTLFVASTLNIQRDAELIIKGRVVVLDGGRINNQGGTGGGTITVAPTGTLFNAGWVENVTNSTIANNGTIINDGRFEIRAGVTFYDLGDVEGQNPLNINRNAIVQLPAE